MAATNSNLLAESIDLTNKAVIDYFLGNDKKKPTPNHIHDIVYAQNNNISLEYFSSVINIMEELGFIELDTSQSTKDGEIKYLYVTNAGLLLNMNGGMTAEVKSEKRKDNLFKIGQVAVLIGGFYYLIELIKSISPIVKEWWILIFCK